MVSDLDLKLVTHNANLWNSDAIFQRILTTINIGSLNSVIVKYDFVFEIKFVELLQQMSQNNDFILFIGDINLGFNVLEHRFTASIIIVTKYNVQLFLLDLLRLGHISLANIDI